MSNEMVVADKDAWKKMKLIKQSDWDKVVLKLDRNKKQNEKRVQAEIEALEREEERKEEREEARAVRYRFINELEHFVNSKFEGSAIRNASQFKKLTKNELRLLIERLAEKAKPWARFQTTTIWALFTSWIAVPAILAALISGEAAFVAAFIMLLTNGLLTLSLLTGPGTSRSYWKAYQAIKKQDGPKYLSYVK